MRIGDLTASMPTQTSPVPLDLGSFCSAPQVAVLDTSSSNKMWAYVGQDPTKGYLYGYVPYSCKDSSQLTAASAVIPTAPPPVSLSTPAGTDVLSAIESIPLPVIAAAAGIILLLVLGGGK